MESPGPFRCTQSIFDSHMGGKTLYLDRSSRNPTFFFIFITNLSDFLLCRKYIKSCVIIQSLCHEFFIVAAFCLNAKWSTTACPVCFPPSGLPTSILSAFIFKTLILFVMWLLSPVKAYMPTSGKLQTPGLVSRERERASRKSGGRPSSDVQGNDKEGGVGED